MNQTTDRFQIAQLLNNAIFRLRLIGKIEGATLLILLLVAVPMKHLFDLPHGVTFMGPIHGIAFMSYLVVLIECVSGGGFTKAEIFRLSVVVIIPFGPFFNDRLLKNHPRNGAVS